MRYWRTIAPSVVACAVLCGCSRQNIVIDGDNLVPQALEAAAASGYKPSWFGHDTLRIHSWEDFIAPHVIANFEKALGVKVIVDAFDSNEDMLADLTSRKTEYDIITPSSYIIPAMAKAGLIVKLNHRHLPNVRKNFDRTFSPLLIDPHFTYNVPCTVTYTGIHYDRRHLPNAADPQDFAIFGLPALRGRTALFDDMRETLGAGLMSLGYSINSTNPDEIEAGAEQVIRWKKLARRFDDDLYRDDVTTGAVCVAMCYSDQALQAISENIEAAAKAGVQQNFDLPRGGFSIGVDEFVIGVHARNRALAYAFINYFYDVEVACSSMKDTFAIVPVKAAISQLTPRLQKLINLTPDELKRGQVIMDFSNRPAVEKLYEDAWERVQAAGNAD